MSIRGSSQIACLVPFFQIKHGRLAQNIPRRKQSPAENKTYVVCSLLLMQATLAFVPINEESDWGKKLAK